MERLIMPDSEDMVKAFIQEIVENRNEKDGKKTISKKNNLQIRSDRIIFALSVVSGSLSVIFW